MNRAVLAGAFVLLIGAAVFIFTRGPASDPGGGGDARPLLNPRGGRAPAKATSRLAGTIAVSPGGAAKRLRYLLQTDLSGLPRFEEVDQLARRLSDEDLSELIELAGLTNMKDLVPWVRCALYAEWGRRDPEGAIAYLRDPDTENNYDGWAARQAWFSLFRGWSEIDPKAAFAMLQSETFTVYHGDPFGDTIETMTMDPRWNREAYDAIFHGLARLEGAAVWEQVPERGLYRFSALAGLFRGLENADERLAAINRWVQEWTVARHDPNKNPDDSFGEFEGAEKSHDALGRSAALALAEGDVQAGLDWLGTLDGNVYAIPALTRELLESWASRYPEQAVARLENTAPEEIAPLVRGVLRGDPGVAPDILLSITNPTERSNLLMESCFFWTPRSSYFPAPGQPNRLRDDLGRYRALSDVIEASGYDLEHQAVFRTWLDRKLTEARAGE